MGNRVGGKQSSFLPTFVFRPLTPPRTPFGTWRFFIYDAIYCRNPLEWDIPLISVCHCSWQKSIFYSLLYANSPSEYWQVAKRKICWCRTSANSRTSSNLLPTFPYTHPYPTTKPFINPFQITLHICQLKVSYPARINK